MGSSSSPQSSNLVHKSAGDPAISETGLNHRDVAYPTEKVANAATMQYSAQKQSIQSARPETGTVRSPPQLLYRSVKYGPQFKNQARMHSNGIYHGRCHMEKTTFLVVMCARVCSTSKLESTPSFQRGTIVGSPCCPHFCQMLFIRRITRMKSPFQESTDTVNSARRPALDSLNKRALRAFVSSCCELYCVS